MVELFANNGDPDQMLSAAYDLVLHYLPVTRLGVSRLKQINSSCSFHEVYFVVVFDNL